MAAQPLPDRTCDLVMKGGITSGVVYPHAVVELSRAYRFRSIGGTSAGAIAAAASAAAEYGRESAGGGFDRLAELPGWIGSDGNLTALFQPQRRTRRLFELLLAPIRHPRRRGLALAWTALTRYWPAALAGALPGAALVAALLLWGEGAALIAIGLAAALLLLAGGVPAAIAAWAARSATRAITANGYGLCSGMPGRVKGRRAALTPWLADLIDTLAGRVPTESSAPLTFGDLWDGPEGSEAVAGEPWLRLEMMTTNVTNRRAERLPWAGRQFWFDPAEMRRLFPERVVRWMEDHPPAPPPEGQRDRARRQRLGRALAAPLRPMPEPRDLPVVVATRMSLSFPVLLSAVPLWRIDHSRVANQEAGRRWRDWARAQDRSGRWEEVVARAEREGLWPADAPRGRPEHERVWFSDGGVASNFPIHFFDASIPRRPTFGINLRPFHPDSDADVQLAGGAGDGLLDWFYRFDGAPGRLGPDRRLGQFLGGIVRTMQNRVDEAQMRVPGYRERIVHVCLSPSEGGMNLAMDGATIDALTDRGRRAAARLSEAYAVPPADPADGMWDLHRWIRYRSTLAATVELLETVDSGIRAVPEGGARTYAQLLADAGEVPPTSYRPSEGQRTVAREVTDRIAELAARVAASGVSLERDAPRPPPAARIVPQDMPADGR